MSTVFKIARVTELPATPDASTMYIVKSAESPFAELYFTSSDGQDIRHIINKTEIQTLINQSVAEFSNLEVVADIAARDALTPDRNILVLVVDASADATVESGGATYVYTQASTSWTKIAEYESMDITLTWANIQGKPSSTVGAIDDAVSKAHTHANATKLDKIGEDGDGNLTYGGAAVGPVLTVANW